MCQVLIRSVGWRRSREVQQCAPPYAHRGKGVSEASACGTHVCNGGHRHRLHPRPPRRLHHPHHLPRTVGETKLATLQADALALSRTTNQHFGKKNLIAITIQSDLQYFWFSDIGKQKNWILK